MKSIRLLIGTLALAGVINASAQAPVPAVEFTATGTVGMIPNPFISNYGFEFDLAQAVEIVGLGYYDHNQDGLEASHSVGLYDSAGTLLVRTNVMPTDPLTGHFRYRSIPPVTLPAATGYRISTYVGDGDYTHTWQVAGLATQPGVTFVRHRVGGGGGLAFPNGNGGATYEPGVFGPNFLIAAPLAEQLRLTIASTPTNALLLSWPAAPAGWVLLESTNVAVSNWVVSARAPETVDSNQTVLVLPTNGPVFFRLRRP